MIVGLIFVDFASLFVKHLWLVALNIRLAALAEISINVLDHDGFTPLHLMVEQVTTALHALAGSQDELEAIALTMTLAKSGMDGFESLFQL